MTLQLRRAPTSLWTTVNPTLAKGEPGYDETLGILKIGDGVKPWTELPSITASMEALVGGGVFLKNVGAVPPTRSGGGSLYVENGSLKFKGSSGTVTILGLA